MKKLYLYLVQKKILEPGTFIELEPFANINISAKKQFVGGLEEITFTVNSNCIIWENNNKIFSQILLTYFILGSEIAIIENKKIENTNNAILIYNQLNEIIFFNNPIILDEYTLIYIKHCFPYLIEPTHHNLYFLHKYLKT